MSIEIRVARRVLAARNPQEILKEIFGELKKMQAWSQSFISTFKRSRSNSKDAPGDLVWQDEWVAFWTPFNDIQRNLFSLEREMDRADRQIGFAIDPFIEPNLKARVEEAIKDLKFEKRKGKDHIAYSEKNLLEWQKAFSWWVSFSLEGVEAMLK